MLRKIHTAKKLVSWRAIRIRFGECPLCGKTVFVKIDNNELAIRCCRCGGSVVTMSIVCVLKRIVPDLSNKSVYELSSRGPLIDFLSRNVRRLSLSEYFDDIPLGQYKGNVQCQDVQRLTYPDNTFDVCTSTEVFEHVSDDVKGLSEIYRVLKNEGVLVFTVPLHNNTKTIERAVVINGKIKYLLRPEYHDDHLRGPCSVLCFRNYGADIVDRLTRVGFKNVSIVSAIDPTGWGSGRPVVVAHK